MTLKPLRTSSPALIMVSSCCPWGVYILEVDLWICAEWKQTPTSSSSFFQGIGRTRRKTSTVLPSIIKLPLSKTTFLLVKITLSLFALCSVPVDETQKTDVLLKYDQICCIYLSIITPIFSSLPLYPPSFSHVISPSPWRPRGRANTGSCWPASSTSASVSPPWPSWSSTTRKLPSSPASTVRSCTWSDLCHDLWPCVRWSLTVWEEVK